MNEPIYDKIVPDTSILICGELSKLIEENKLSIKKIIIPVAAVDELEQQANKGKETGFLGISELKKLRKLSHKKGFEIEFRGDLPTLDEIKLARSGRIDALIRNVAKEENAVLITSDRVQAEVTEAYGIQVLFLGKKIEEKEKLIFEQWFDENTTSLHIKENCKIRRKLGSPGNWILKEIDVILDDKSIEEIVKEILEVVRRTKDSFIEIERPGSIIVQYKNYRIVVVKPPVSDGWEVTIVRPLKKLKLEDYNLSEKLLKRLKEKSEGIIIAGKPGSGKTTFVQALAEWYSSQGKIVKTVESPRDLIVSDEITQYSKNFARPGELHDILLLARPDYVVFDEIRDTPDFDLYKDLRLAGVGMLGVVHAERPIDVIQRFVARTELGLIPQIIDTVIFIEKGKPSKVYSLELVVKVPTGMHDEDLARPVVEIRDFETGNLEYEMYTFGEEIVIVPVSKVERKEKPLESLACKFIEEEIKNMLRTNNVKVEVVSGNKINVYVPKKLKSNLIGRRGKKIEKLEEKLGVKISVKTFEEEKYLRNFLIKDNGDYVIIDLGPEFGKKKVGIYIDNNLITIAKTSKTGKIKFSKDSVIGRKIIGALHNEKDIKIELY